MIFSPWTPFETLKKVFLLLHTKHKFFHASLITFFGQIASLGLTFFSFLIIARSLGEGDFGEFIFLISFITICALLPDFGLNPIVLRELSKTPSQASGITGNVLFLRFLLFIAVVIVSNIVLGFLQMPANFRLLANIMLLNILISSKVAGIRLVLESPLRAEMRLLGPLSLAALDSLVLLVVLIAIPGIATSLGNIVMVYTVSNVPGSIILLLWLLKEKKISFDLNLTVLKFYIREAFPMAIYVGLIALYNGIDVILLKTWRSAQEVGELGAATRLSAPLMFIPNTAIVVLYPLISKWFMEKHEKLKELYQAGLKTLLCIGLIVVVVGFFVSEPLIGILFSGKFKASSILLFVLLLSQVFFSLNFFGTGFITAMNQQKKNAWSALIALCIDIVFNVFSIPFYGSLGVVMARTFSEVVCCAFILWVTSSFLTNNFWEGAIKLGLGAIVSIVIVHLLNLHSVFGEALIALFIFIFWVIFTKVFSDFETRQIRLALRNTA